MGNQEPPSSTTEQARRRAVCELVAVCARADQQQLRAALEAGDREGILNAHGVSRDELAAMVAACFLTTERSGPDSRGST